MINEMKVTIFQVYIRDFLQAKNKMSEGCGSHILLCIWEAETGGSSEFGDILIYIWSFRLGLCIETTPAKKSLEKNAFPPNFHLYIKIK